MSASRSLFARLLFALLLVFGQERAVLHALEHDVDRIHQTRDASGHAHDVCAECLAIAHLDHADGVAPFRFSAAAFVAPPFAAAGDVDAPQASPTRYHSRAPPALS